MWQFRREFNIRSPRLVATCVFLAVAVVLLAIAIWQYRDARRYLVEAIEVPVVSARVVPAGGHTSTVYELTYRRGRGSEPERTESVPVALWESARDAGRVYLKPTVEGDVRIWRPVSGLTMGIVAGIGVAFLGVALAITISGIRAWRRARRGEPAPHSSIDRVLSRVSFWTLFGSIWLGVGVPFLALTVVFAWQDFRLSTSGRTIEGVVLVKEVRQNGKRGSQPTYAHSVQYRFEADGFVREGRSDVSESTWMSLVEREPLRVEYLPGSARLHRIAGTHERTELVIFGGVGLLIGGAGALIIRADWRQRRKVKRLRESGVRTLARIVSVEAARLRVNREPLWKIRYEYRDREHRTRQGSTYVTPAEAERWKAGDTAAILLDPDAPRSTVWIGEASEASA